MNSKLSTLNSQLSTNTTILVLNCGSSSVKFKIFKFPEEKVLLKGIVERIGATDSIIRIEDEKRVTNIPDHHQAIFVILDKIKNLNIEIDGIGHRVVHGGEYNKSMIINEDVKRTIKRMFEIAPLHNPYNYEGILACEKNLPGKKQVAVFDTSYFAELPDYAYLYGISYKYYKKYGIRKYGFHGTSHRYVSMEAAKILGEDFKKLKIISCHLGAGSSITATKQGRAIETSMGFTPLEGLIMATRCGDIDPAVPLFIMTKEELNPSRLNVILNKQSGIYGISGISGDFRDILKEMKEGNYRAKLAFKMFCYRVKKYIGSYHAILGGVDVLIFTAGIGENVPLVREEITRNLEHLGIEIDHRKNRNPKNYIISKETSKCKVLVIPTNEELMIARETKDLISSS